MATATKTFVFASTAEGWAGVGLPSGQTVAFTSAQGNPTGALQVSSAGKNITAPSDANSGTSGSSWATFFGIPTNATVTNIFASGDGYDSKASAYTTGAASTDGPLSVDVDLGSGIFTTFDNFICTTARTYSAVDGSWGNRPVAVGNIGQAVTLAGQAATNLIRFRYDMTIKTGNSNSAVNTLNVDNIKVTITYTTPGGGSGSALFLAGN